MKYLFYLSLCSLLISCGSYTRFSELSVKDYPKENTTLLKVRYFSNLSTSNEYWRNYSGVQRTYWVHFGDTMYQINGAYEPNFKSTNPKWDPRSKTYEYKEGKWLLENNIYFKGVIEKEFWKNKEGKRVYEENLSTPGRNLNSEADIPYCFQTHIFVKEIERNNDEYIIRDKYITRAVVYYYSNGKKKARNGAIIGGVVGGVTGGVIGLFIWLFGLGS